MPVDPTISLGIQTPSPAPASGPGSPLGMINTWSEIQNRQNQNQNFQQTFAAKQRAGQLMSAAPDLDSAFGAMLKDPLVAPFAGGIINEVRQSQKTLLDIQGEQQSQAQSGLAAVMKAIPGAVGDPSMLPALISSHMKTLSPTARERVAPAVDDLTKALMDGLPSATDMKSDPRLAQLASSTLQNRFLGIATASGMSADTMRAISGTMPPGVDFQPVGPGGSLVPVTKGGSVFQPNQIGIAGAGGGTPGNSLGLPSQAPIAGPTRLQEHYLDKRGTNLAEDQTRLDSDVQSQYMIQQVIAEGKEALKSFKPGGGADIYRRLGTLAQGLGASTDLVDKISNGNLAATQEFEKLMVNNVMAQIKSQLPSGSRLAQYEFRVFEQRNPNISTDPRAIDKIFNFWDKLYARSVDEQSSLNQFLAKGGDINIWPAEWQKQAKVKGYTSGSVIGSGPAQTDQPAATHRWEPGRGLVPN